MSICLGTVWVCTDCMILAVNGDETDPSYRGDPDVVLLDKIPDFHMLTSGFGTDEHAEDCTEEIRANDGCECETNNFSTSSCDGCGSHLHGERHAMTLWKSAQAPA